jgi:hypothetical protein
VVSLASRSMQPGVLAIKLLGIFLTLYDIIVSVIYEILLNYKRKVQGDLPVFASLLPFMLLSTSVAGNFI